MENMIPNKLDQRATKAAENRPDVQTAFYGINTSSCPYLLNQHSPYLMNMKFNDSGQGMNRRDGHKVYKRFTDSTILTATQALNGDIYYITKENISDVVLLHSIVKNKYGHKEYSIDISKFVTFTAGDKIDNFDVIVGFTANSLDVFPYFNILKPDGSKSVVFLQTDKQLSTVAVNASVVIAGSSSSPNIVTHSYFNERLFIVVENANNEYELHWGVAGAVSLTISIAIPNDDEVFAMKTFSDSLFLFCENTVYRVAFDNQASKASIQVNSENYGITSNKLIKTIGSTIYYYGESSGLASMMGSTADSILDATSQQRPSDYYMSNFHKVFKANQICYKKDDKSLYIIGALKCNYVSEALHWQQIYTKVKMTDAEYETSLAKFRADINDKNRFILEYNVAMQRFSLHYYDKEILGHFNFRLNIAGLDKDQSSELIFTEDYIATTSNDFTTDDDSEFPVQINSIPKSQGMFEGYITSTYVVNVKFCTNKEPTKDSYVLHVPCDIPMSILNDGYTLYRGYSGQNEVTSRISQVMQIRTSQSDINPSLLVGFSSRDILIFEGFQVNSQVSAAKTM